MIEPTEIWLSHADLLAELAFGAMAREVEMDESAEAAEIGASTVLPIVVVLDGWPNA